MRIPVQQTSFLISGTHSGVGKTTTSFILMAFLHRMGYRIQPFKHGPDFIDPGYHLAATGINSINLDFWMMGKEQIVQSFHSYMANMDCGIIEGMGALFDGKNGTEEGSAAHLAKTLSIPIVLVVDIYGMTRSVNATLKGFSEFDPNIQIAGIVFNRAGSKKHYKMILDSLMPQFRSLSLGYLPRFAINFPERHLGLLTIEENKNIMETLEANLKEAKESFDFDKLIKKIGPLSQKKISTLPALKKPSKIRLGVAKDEAFCFYYKQNLNLLEEAGAELVYFSPLQTKRPPESLDGLYFGGGYPELFAKQLSENDVLKNQILEFANASMPIYAECGGLIYLCETLLLEDEERVSMVGVFPYIVKWDKNYLAIRYVEIKTSQDTILGPKGTIVRGQEFHQTRLLNPLKNSDNSYEITSSTNEKFAEGFCKKNVLASYMHLYFPSAIGVSNHFIAKCEEYRKKKIC